MAGTVTPLRVEALAAQGPFGRWRIGVGQSADQSQSWSLLPSHLIFGRLHNRILAIVVTDIFRIPVPASTPY